MYAGFGLLELTLCLTIMAVLAYAAMPAMSELVERHMLRWRAHDLADAVAYAKVQALYHNRAVYLLPLANQHDWSQGIQVCVHHIWLRSPPTDAECLQIWQWSAPHYPVEWHGFQGEHALQFLPDLAHAAMNGYFLVQGRHFAIKIILNRLGRVNVDNV